MKRVISQAGAILVIIAFLLVVICQLSVVKPAFAHDAASESSAMASSAAYTDYPLAYPGILPDNPLYFLKAARDKLVSFLISDNEKKAEFNLLTSDKRVNAAFMLAKSGKAKISLETLSKSNNYLEQAISNLTSAEKEGKDVNAQLRTVYNSIHKHLDLVAGIKNKLGKKYSGSVTMEQKRLEKFDKSVTKLITK